MTDMLPDRELDIRAIARQIIVEHDLPYEIHAYRHTTFNVENTLVEILTLMAQSQTKVADGPWRYTYDPLTVDRKTLALSILDESRRTLGCHEYGCHMAADLDDITFLDNDEHILNRDMEREQ